LSLRAPARVEGGRDLHSVSSFLVANWRIRFFRSPSDLGTYPDAWKEAMDDPGPVAHRRVLTLRRTQHAIREVPGWRDFAAIADARLTLPPGRYVVGTRARGAPRVFVNDDFTTNGEVISVGDAPIDLRIELAVSEDFYRFGLEIEPEGLAPLRPSRDTTTTESGLGRDHWIAAAATVRNEIDTTEAESPEERHALTDRMNYLAWVLDKHLDDPAAALPVLKQAEAIRRDLYPDPGHWAPRWEENRIAEIVARINDVELLREGYQRAIRRGTLYRGPQARVALQLAMVLRAEGRIEEALRVERAVISAVRDASKRGEGMTAAHAYGIFQHFTEAGILTTGREIAELAIELAEDVFGVASVEYTFRLNELGKLLTRCGEPREALEPLRRSREIRVALLGERHAEVGRVDRLIVDALEEAGDVDDSIALRRSVIACFQLKYGSIHADTCRAFDELVEALQRLGRDDEAAVTIREELERLTTPPFNGSHNAFRIRQLQQNVAKLERSQVGGR
jgi:tetratricopeptide (TPR) repeat protein